MSEQTTQPVDELERVVQAAQDAVTDDMVVRLSENAAAAMDLLDRVSRSGLERAIPAIADLVNNGDLDRIVKLARIYGAAEDAVTDDMVGRLTETVGGGLDLLDQVNRAEVGRAIPAIARMVHDGDLERLVQLARIYGSAEDALTDDMVGRLADTVGGGLSLLDQVNRSNLERALPIISRMVADGDLERIAQYARVIGAAEDALTDEMVGRLAETIGEGISVVDRLHRGGVTRLVELLEKLSSSGALDKVMDGLPRLIENMELLQQMFSCFENAAKQSQETPPPAGLMDMLRVLRDPETGKTLHFALALGRQMRDTCARRST